MEVAAMADSTVKIQNAETDVELLSLVVVGHSPL
jgi:hypothetical protein